VTNLCSSPVCSVNIRAILSVSQYPKNHVNYLCANRGIFILLIFSIIFSAEKYQFIFKGSLLSSLKLFPYSLKFHYLDIIVSHFLHVSHLNVTYILKSTLSLNLGFLPLSFQMNVIFRLSLGPVYLNKIFMYFFFTP